MANTFKFGNGNWAVGKETVLAYNDQNNNFKPLPFSFTRNSTATYVDSDGLIKTAGQGEARIDYLDNADGHLLLEPSRTNLFTYSEDFSASIWALNGSATREANATISPDGTLNAYKITSNGGNIGYGQGGVVSENSTYEISFFAKKGTDNIIQITESFYIGSSTIFDLESGSITSGNGTIESYSNDWYRCSVSYTYGAGQTILSFNLKNTGSGYFYLFGFQGEQGSYPTSYIPTEGSSVTRVNEDILIKGFQDTILNGGDAPFALFIDFENYTLESIGDSLLFLDETDGTSTQGRAYLYNSSAGFGQDWNDNPVSLTNNSSVKLLWNYTSSTEGYVWKNETKGSLNSGPNAVDFDYLKIVSQFNLLKINRILIYNTALTDTEAQNLTT